VTLRVLKFMNYDGEYPIEMQLGFSDERTWDSLRLALLGLAPEEPSPWGQSLAARLLKEQHPLYPAQPTFDERHGYTPTPVEVAREDSD
jgi:hypothetical protein